MVCLEKKGSTTEYPRLVYNDSFRETSRRVLTHVGHTLHLGGEDTILILLVAGAEENNGLYVP